MAAFSEQNGFVKNGLTSWALMTQGAALLGLESEKCPPMFKPLQAPLS